MNRKIGRIAVLAVPILILLLMIVKPLLTLSTGNEITLQTKPVDPRDLFRGDYVYLEYEIEDITADQLDADLLKKAKKKGYGDIPMYAVLNKQRDVYELERATAKKPDDGIYLKGTLFAYEDWVGENKTVAKYQANFNLDRYYVPENTGKSLEEGARKGKVIAHVKVRNGYGILTGLEMK